MERNRSDFSQHVGVRTINVAVVGLWHLGTVTAACVASAGHRVVAYDPDPALIDELRQARLPVAEPGLAQLTRAELETGRLQFSADLASIRNAEIVWITFETPVDDEDRANVEFVIQQVSQLFAHLAAGSIVLVSSQLPVGSVGRLEQMYRAACPEGGASFACSPENLRLGNALELFLKADRFVVGTRTPADRGRLGELLRPFTSQIEWMSVESAEMTKHAINAFLAVSVTFINEVAALCERVGASAREVEQGLKSDRRIGPGAYVRPGAAIAGGTLARDITYLVECCAAAGFTAPLLSAVPASNRQHKEWARQRLQALLGSLQKRTVAVLGLTYKPGTDTLRRSSALELCSWLSECGTHVRAFDPAVLSLPPALSDKITVCASWNEAVRGAEAVVVATEWPELLDMTAADLVRTAGRIPLVLDASGFLEKTLGGKSNLRYLTVGRAA
jgi:UDPglucose 6-dehydrogenase